MYKHENAMVEMKIGNIVPRAGNQAHIPGQCTDHYTT